MPYPVFDEYITELQTTVALQLEAASVSLNEWLSKQHKPDGSHGAITADSLTVSGAVTLSGATTISTPTITDLIVTNSALFTKSQNAISHWDFTNTSTASGAATELRLTAGNNVLNVSAQHSGPTYYDSTVAGGAGIAELHFTTNGNEALVVTSNQLVTTYKGLQSCALGTGSLTAGTGSPSYVFSVDGATGNTLVAGTLGVTARATLTADLVLTTNNQFIQGRKSGGTQTRIVGIDNTDVIALDPDLIGMTMGLFTASRNQSAESAWALKNTTAGAAARTVLRVFGDETSGLALWQTSTTYNTAASTADDPPNIASASSIVSGRGGGLNIVGANGPIRFYQANASTVRATLNSAGFGIGKVPSASPFAIGSIPTSSAGLASGDVWSNSGVLTIV